MSEYKYTTIIEHYEKCLARHGDTHLGVDWPNQQDADTRYRVMLEVVREDASGLSLLDFGCGASQLYPYMVGSRFAPLLYSGLDASPAFCELSRSKFPHNDYVCLDVLEAPEQLKEFDYVVMNGVFTEKRELSFDEMFEYFKRVLRVVFAKARRGLAFNVMSKAVDWERDDLFHLPADALITFLTGDLSRNFVIRNDYGLYEYTVYIYKEARHG